MKKLSVGLLFLFLTSGMYLNGQTLEKQLDAIFETEYPSGHPGAVVLVAKDGKPVYRKAFGSADLELGVAMTPEHIIELGSITKQFTAVAILMLMEEGKLSLKDPLTKYISDYPNGENVTVHHLLNHTSGIKSYTDMSDFRSMAAKDMSPMELIAVFRDEPVDFAPGENYRYNNSGYILLGYIVEKVSGMTYEEFIETRIFATLGMKNSLYGSKREIITNRASGYTPSSSGNGYKNAEYLSMTLPYAAGSLMSTVDDLLLWNQAVRNNSLISEKSKQLAFKVTTLNNGKTSYYGYGWGINELYDSPTLEHGGGIFGYTTNGIYLPKENIYTIVLTNTNGKNPADFALQATATVLGKPLNQSSVSLPENLLKQWTGAYAFEDGTVRYITYKDGSLYSRREGGEAIKLHTLSEKEYRFDNSFTTYLFGIENGKKTVVFADRIEKSKGEETDKIDITERKGISVDQAILDSYRGVYELQPGFVITVTTTENQIFAQATGQASFEIFAESPNKFFLKVVPATITFNEDEKGNVKSLTLDQGGQKMEAKKIK